MSDVRQFEIHVGVTGRTSKVLLDGQVVPKATRVLIDCGVGQPTRLEIHAYKGDGEPYVIKGYMIEDPSQPSLADGKAS